MELGLQILSEIVGVEIETIHADYLLANDIWDRESGMRGLVGQI